MTKEAIQEARDLSKGFPTKVICDNMLIFNDNNDKYALHCDIQYPNLIWDDANERFICIRPNTMFEQNQLPVSIMVVPYDQIQYIEVFADTVTALGDVKYLTEKYGISEDQQTVIKNMMNKVVSAIPYKTGSRPIYAQPSDTASVSTDSAEKTQP